MLHRLCGKRAVQHIFIGKKFKKMVKIHKYFWNIS